MQHGGQQVRHCTWEVWGSKVGVGALGGGSVRHIRHPGWQQLWTQGESLQLRHTGGAHSEAAALLARCKGAGAAKERLSHQQAGLTSQL